MFGLYLSFTYIVIYMMHMTRTFKGPEMSGRRCIFVNSSTDRQVDRIHLHEHPWEDLAFEIAMLRLVIQHWSCYLCPSHQLCRARPSYITHPLSDIRTRIYWDRLCQAWTMQMYPTHLILSPLPKAHMSFLSVWRKILAFLHYSVQKYSYDSGKCNMETTQIDH